MFVNYIRSKYIITIKIYDIVDILLIIMLNMSD